QNRERHRTHWAHVLCIDPCEGSALCIVLVWVIDYSKDPLWLASRFRNCEVKLMGIATVTNKAHLRCIPDVRVIQPQCNVLKEEVLDVRPRHVEQVVHRQDRLKK